MNNNNANNGQKKTNTNRKRFKHENRVSPSVCVFEFWACVCVKIITKELCITHTQSLEIPEEKKILLVTMIKIYPRKRVKVKNYYQIKRCYM